jgi:hypothetical protein
MITVDVTSDPNGTYLRRTVINVDLISRIVSVGANCCRVVMRAWTLLLEIELGLLT